MEKKNLLESHKELLREKRSRANEAVVMARMKQQELQNTVNLIAKELGIPPKEEWTLDKNSDYFYKKVKVKKPKSTIPGKRKNRKR